MRKLGDLLVIVGLAGAVAPVIAVARAQDPKRAFQDSLARMKERQYAANVGQKSQAAQGLREAMQVDPDFPYAGETRKLLEGLGRS